MGKTTLRNIRIATDLWDALGAQATAEGVTRSELIRRLITDYLKDTK